MKAKQRIEALDKAKSMLNEVKEIVSDLKGHYESLLGYSYSEKYDLECEISACDDALFGIEIDIESLNRCTTQVYMGEDEYEPEDY